MFKICYILPRMAFRDRLELLAGILGVGEAPPARQRDPGQARGGRGGRPRRAGRQGPRHFEEERGPVRGAHGPYCPGSSRRSREWWLQSLRQGTLEIVEPVDARLRQLENMVENIDARMRRAERWFQRAEARAERRRQEEAQRQEAERRRQAEVPQEAQGGPPPALGAPAVAGGEAEEEMLLEL